MDAWTYPANIKRISLATCYWKYKAATKVALNELFASKDELKDLKDQPKWTRADIKDRVRTCRKRKQIPSAEFFKSLRRAIFYRTLAGTLYARHDRSSGEVTHSNNDRHQNFIEFLVSIEKDLSFEPQAGQTYNDNLQRIRREVDLEDLEDTESAEELASIATVYDKEQSSGQTLGAPHQDLLGTDPLSARLELLDSLKRAIDNARTLRAELDAGVLDVTTWSLLSSISYQDIKSLCSGTALLVDSWSEIDMWVDRAVWKEFDLEDHYDNLKFVVMVWPLLRKTCENWIVTENKTLFSLSGTDFVSISTLNSCKMLQTIQKVPDEQLEPAVKALRTYTCNLDFDVSDLRDACTNVSNPLYAQFLHTDFLQHSLLSLMVRRREHQRLSLSTRLVENPVIADLHDFITEHKPVAAIAAMLGIGLMCAARSPSEHRDREHRVQTALGIVYEAGLESDNHAKMMSEQNIFKTRTTLPVWGRNQYAPMIPNTDQWTIGLCFAQRAAACIGRLLIILVDSEVSPALFEFIMIVDKLKLAGAKVQAHFAEYMENLRTLYGCSERPSNFDAVGDLCRRNKRTKQKITSERLQKQMNNPYISLIQLLLDNEYCLRAEWTHKLWPRLSYASLGSPEVQLRLRRELIRQQGRAYMSSLVVTSALAVRRLDLAMSELAPYPKLNPSAATERAVNLERALYTHLVFPRIYSIWPRPSYRVVISTNAVTSIVSNLGRQRQKEESDRETLGEGEGDSIVRRSDLFAQLMQPYSPLKKLMLHFCSFDIEPIRYQWPAIVWELSSDNTTFIKSW